MYKIEIEIYEGKGGELEKDEEGISTMRTLGKNLPLKNPYIR